MEEIGKDKVLELKFEFYMAKELSYIATGEKGDTEHSKAFKGVCMCISVIETIER